MPFFVVFWNLLECLANKKNLSITKWRKITTKFGALCWPLKGSKNLATLKFMLAEFWSHLKRINRLKPQKTASCNSTFVWLKIERLGLEPHFLPPFNRSEDKNHTRCSSWLVVCLCRCWLQSWRMNIWKDWCAVESRWLWIWHQFPQIKEKGQTFYNESPSEWSFLPKNVPLIWLRYKGRFLQNLPTSKINPWISNTLNFPK